MMNNKGFTLIELVVVIVILGILAVTAAPKFMNLKADAKTSTLYGVQAAMQSAAALVYGKSIVKGNHKEAFSTSNTVNIGDEAGFYGNGELFITYGYPIGDEDEFERLVPLDAAGTYKYHKLGTSIKTLLVYFEEDYKDPVTPTTIEDPCIVVYQIPEGPGQSPSFNVNDCI
ncbi:type II secretion system protein [Colwellia psychrerythraea]|nr:type II secretion system protein [Colwellia psychrerythraea]